MTRVQIVNLVLGILLLIAGNFWIGMEIGYLARRRPMPFWVSPVACFAFSLIFCSIVRWSGGL